MSDGELIDQQKQCTMRGDGSGTESIVITSRVLFETIASCRVMTSLFVCLIVIGVWIVRKLWKEWNVSYNIRLIKEYFFSSPIPIIHVPILTIPSEPQREGSPLGTKLCTEIFDPTRPNKIQCYNPSTNEWLGEVDVMSTDEIDSIIQKAAIAQKEWVKTTYEQRRRVLRTIQQYVTNNVQTICAISAIDSGKAVVDAALGEVITTTEKIRTICAYGELWLQSESRPVSPMLMHKLATVEYSPLGIIATIAPWNYPFHNMINHVISGIFAGNAVVGKVSEYTSWSAVHYYDHIVKQALLVNGHNPDLVATITGFGPSGSALCSHPLIDKIIFTGSPAIGKKVMETASEFLKPVILELGGKDALVLMDDINIQSIIPWVLRGCYQNCGQNCVGVERVLVYESLYTDFVTAIIPRVQQIRQGVPATNECQGNDIDCGSMVTVAQINLIQELIDDAVKLGARVLIGGMKPVVTTSGGQFYPPTVIVDVTCNMRIYQEEVFGPVMTIIKVPNDDDSVAIQMINNSSFGLGFSVYSNNQQRALNLGRQIHSGMCVINDFGSNYLIQTLPFGGVKESGFGRFAGIEGLRALCLEQSILIDRFPSIVRTSIPPVIDYPINNDKGLPFVTSLIKFFYSESIMEKIKGIIGLIKFGL